MRKSHLRALIQKSPLLVRIVHHIAPLKAFRDSRKAVQAELKQIRSFIEGGGNQFQIRYSDLDCFSGLGDFLLVLALGRFLERLGWACEVKRVDSSERTDWDSKDELWATYGPSGTLDFQKPIHQLFSERVASRLDISGPSLSLLSRIQSDALLNPTGAKPSLLPHPSRQSRCEEVGKGFVAFHVRASYHSLDRNPPNSLIMSDLRALCSAFPSLDIRWFGEKPKFEEVRKLLPLTIQQRLYFQHSKTFASAGQELMTAVFWFQRAGGGIGVFPLFSPIPYVILSNDVSATRLYDRLGLSLVPWATKFQQYHIQVFRTAKSLDRVLAGKGWRQLISLINSDPANRRQAP